MGRGALLIANLPQLQNLIKRDPASYKEEFLQQWNHYNSIRQIFKLKPDEHSDRFRELITFIAQVAPCYPKETADFFSHLSTLLLESYGMQSPETRKTLVQTLVVLRNKNAISSIDLLKTLFPILPRTTSPTLRTLIRKTVLSDIRNANLRSKNHKLNRAVQAMLFTMVERGMDGQVGDSKKSKTAGASGQASSSRGDAMWAVIVTKELWRKRVWNDAKSVSIIALGCLHPDIKVQSASIHFFLGTDDDVEDSDNEDETPDVKSLQHRREINKKTRSGDKKYRKSLNTIKKKRDIQRTKTPNFPALQLLNDPQTFAERLYGFLTRFEKHFSLDHKILIMQLLSRVMGAHKLCVLGFYSYIVKYLTYHQLRVPSILVALAQAVHDLTPPDAVTPVVRKIANEFVHPGVASEVIAAGLNAIREVCRRQPWTMEEDLLEDLVEYRKSKDKGVIAAARGLLQLYREINPGMLKRSERGKEASMGLTTGAKPLPFGHTAEAAVDIEGLVLLEDHLQQLRSEEKLYAGVGGNGGDGKDGSSGDDDEAAWAGWDIQTDSSSEDSDDTRWIDVDSSGEECFEVRDSEDDVHANNNVVPSKAEGQAEPSDTTPRVSTLATTKVLTPADFALLNELRIRDAKKAVESGAGARAKRKLATLQADKQTLHQSSQADNTFISESDILGPRKKSKADYAERVASIEKGREGRERYGSSKGKKKKEVPSSSTNKEKARNKPIMMVLSSGAVRSKKKASLREKQRKLRAHVDRAKKAHH